MCGFFTENLGMFMIMGWDNLVPGSNHLVGSLFRELLRYCYAQALGVVDVGSLSVELSWRIRVRSGRPSCRASQGQNHGVRRGCRGSGEVRQSA